MMVTMLILVIDDGSIFFFLVCALFNQRKISIIFRLSLLQVSPHKTFILLFISLLLLLLLQAAKLEIVLLINVFKKDYFQFNVFILFA